MKILQNTFSGLLLMVLLLAACTQNDKPVNAIKALDSSKSFTANEYVKFDQSPLDISYYPNEYPQLMLGKNWQQEPPVARIIYSRPHKKGRIIFGNDEKSLCKYGKPWRLGANEATEIEFFKPVVIGGKNVAVGRYLLYCIPYEDKWVVIFNSNLYSWGLQIDPSNDIMQIEVPVQKQDPALEDFTIIFNSTSAGADIVMAWDDVKVMLPVNFSR